MTREQFQKNEELCSVLRSTLQSTAFLAAVQILKDEAEPRIGVNEPVIAANRYQQLAGANDLLTRLTTLASPVQKNKAAAFAPKTLDTEPPKPD